MNEPYVVKLTISRDAYEARKAEERARRLVAEINRLDRAAEDAWLRRFQRWAYGSMIVKAPSGLWGLESLIV